MTLTYKENITDREYSNYEFKKFIQKLKRLLKKYGVTDLKYLAPIETQKRGALHYHILLFDVPFIPVFEIQKRWIHGNINIKQVKSDGMISDEGELIPVSRVGLYISKYFSKSFEDKEKSKKAYLSSRNLNKPITETYNNYCIYEEALESFSNLHKDNIICESNYIRYVNDIQIGSYDKKLRQSNVKYFMVRKQGKSD